MMAPFRGESAWEKFGTFLSLVHPKDKKLIHILERIKLKISTREVSNMFKRENTAY